MQNFILKYHQRSFPSSHHCICSCNCPKTQKYLKIFTGHEPSIWLSQQVQIFILLNFVLWKTPTESFFCFVFFLFPPYSISNKQKGHCTSTMNLLPDTCFRGIFSGLRVLEKVPKYFVFHSASEVVKYNPLSKNTVFSQSDFIWNLSLYFKNLLMKNVKFELDLWKHWNYLKMQSQFFETSVGYVVVANLK